MNSLFIADNPRLEVVLVAADFVELAKKLATAPQGRYTIIRADVDGEARIPRVHGEAHVMPAGARIDLHRRGRPFRRVFVESPQFQTGGGA